MAQDLGHMLSHSEPGVKVRHGIFTIQSPMDPSFRNSSMRITGSDLCWEIKFQSHVKYPPVSLDSP